MFQKGIPFYVGLMGLATEGHKGFVDGIREGVLLHSIATGAYMSVPHLVKRREKVSVIDVQAQAKGENIYGEVGLTPAAGTTQAQGEEKEKDSDDSSEPSEKADDAEPEEKVRTFIPGMIHGGWRKGWWFNESLGLQMIV